MNAVEIGRFYDKHFGADGNMSRQDFIREFQEATNPQGIQRDLAAIELAKAQERTNRMRIDRAMGNRGVGC